MIGEQQRVKEEVEVEAQYIVGEDVKILDGPFSTFNGKVQSIKGDKVKVEVSVFGRISLIELNVIQIDKNNG